jgi:hypothetical protein
MADAAAEYLATWRPSGGWHGVVRDALAVLRRDERERKAWGQLAVMLGDCHAAPLCFLVCYHANTLGDPNDEDGKILGSSMTLACCDLGLATWKGERLVFDYEAGRVWLARELTPFEIEPPSAGGDAWRFDGTPPPAALPERAAWFCLGLAALRTGVVSEAGDWSAPPALQPHELEGAGLTRVISDVVAGARPAAG